MSEENKQWQNPIRTEKDKKIVKGMLYGGITITVAIAAAFVVLFVWMFT
ncbi:hypothetical protein [Rossellomorea vietnamensis]|nr:hypothetical protein [Rossellomorea vietnamensis]